MGSLALYRGSLLDVKADAIVNAANASLMGGGGVDGVIHRAAGPDLKEACKPLAPCPTGELRVTPGFLLGDVLVFHTVGPIWQGGAHGEARLLKNCYVSCLEEAVQRRLGSIVFPAISTGAYGFPAEAAAKIAVETCADYAGRCPIDITLAAIDRKNASSLSIALNTLPD